MAGRNMDKLLNVMARLRDPKTGCPWDIEQDFHTIAPYTIEEAYEVADAIDRKDWADLKDELGDLLLQVVFHAQMAEEESLFNFEDVVDAIHGKMIRRHPHVFGQEKIESASEQTENWEDLKARERKEKARNEGKSVLGEIPKPLPALDAAYKLQTRAARVGFDWPDIDPVYDKVDEEMRELQEAVVADHPEQMKEEFGDLLFSCVNLGRKLGINPTQALQAANMKFRNRFEAMEGNIRAEQREIEDLSLDQLEENWRKAKSQGL